MRVGILGCKGTTLDLLHNLNLRGELKVAQLITLSDEQAYRNKVAFFEGPRLRAYCDAASIPVHTVQSYTLKDPADLAFFQSARFDLLLVLGWERLLPGQILETLTYFACGMHGSAYGLPKGRGRSPMNWAVLTGQPKFITYLFRYTFGMDDGDLIGFRVFDITSFDDISTLHTKNRIAMGELVHEYAPRIADGTLSLFSQPQSKPTYYPKRTREDGFIDWHESSGTIHRLVRAVAPPYPGALTRLYGQEVQILAGQPFDSGLFDQGIAPGTIIDINLSLGRIVVKSGDGAFLITDPGDLNVAALSLGMLFDSVPASEILAEIRTRYPDWISSDQREI